MSQVREPRIAIQEDGDVKKWEYSPFCGFISALPPLSCLPAPFDQYLQRDPEILAELHRLVVDRKNADIQLQEDEEANQSALQVMPLLSSSPSSYLGRISCVCVCVCVCVL
jgi:hypothetical protein